MPSLFRLALGACLLVGLAAPPAHASPDDDPIATVTTGDTDVTWLATRAGEQTLLTLRGPGGLELRRQFAPGDRVSVDAAALDLADGDYTYEFVLVSPAGTGAEAEARAGRAQSGALALQDGRFALASPAFIDDVEVVGSLCVGLDCADGVTYGFDTVLLKENNLRIKFDDTSNSGSFASNDWEITINDSDNGGANYFEIRDVTGLAAPFRIAAGAPTNSLWVDANGDLGVGIGDAVTEIHTRDGDTPTLRLEQDGSNGWTPYTWDVAGNEANFFIRNATDGSKLVFRAFPDASSDNLTLRNARVGINSANPSATLDMRMVAGQPALNITNTTTGETVMSVSEAGDTVIHGTITGADKTYPELIVNGALVSSGNFSIAGTGAPYTLRDNKGTADGADDETLMRVNRAGNMLLKGVVVEGSSRFIKEGFLPVDTEDVLARTASMPVTTWQYIGDDGGGRHMGVMAQDFHAAFGLGADDAHIASLDVSGALTASVQALHARNEADRATIASLRAELAEQTERLARLEAAVDALTSNR